jgi:hypothetical protein
MKWWGSSPPLFFEKKIPSKEALIESCYTVVPMPIPLLLWAMATMDYLEAYELYAKISCPREQKHRD